MDESRKVMVVDDDLMSVMRVEEHLREAGYRVVRLSSPNGALSKIDYEEPEILLLDIEMARLDPEELIETLRASSAYRDLVVVVHSDQSAEELENYCVDHDVNGYYCKSMETARIPEFLEEFFD